MTFEHWLIALLVGAYVPYPYSWKDGSDVAWRMLNHRLRFARALQEVLDRHGAVLERLGPE